MGLEPGGGRSARRPKRTTAKARDPLVSTQRGAGAATVDEYLLRLDATTRTALSKLRAHIREAAPQAEERISYQIPTYILNGPLVHFAAQTQHLSFTLVSMQTMDAFRKELAGFTISGRTVHFSPDRPIPGPLVKKIVKARIKENVARKK